LAINLLKSGQWEVLPGVNGTNMLRPTSFNNQDRLQKPLIPLSPFAPNPDTHQTEDTLATYRKDMQTASAVLPRLFAPEQISVSTSSPRGINGQVPAGSDGVYWLSKADTGQMLIPLGKPLHVTSGSPSALDMQVGAETGNMPALPTKEVLVPEDPQEAAKVLHDILPDGHGLVLMPNDPTHPTGFLIGYKPYVTGKTTPEPTDAEMQRKREGVLDTWRAFERTAAPETYTTPGP
jgi:hypothetical protein